MNTLATPSNIEVLLWCHTRPQPHPRLDAPAVRDAVQEFLKIGAVEATPLSGGGEFGAFRTTPLGRAWVAALCQVQRPRVGFIDENGKAIKT